VYWVACKNYYYIVGDGHCSSSSSSSRLFHELGCSDRTLRGIIMEWSAYDTAICVRMLSNHSGQYFSVRFYPYSVITHLIMSQHQPLFSNQNVRLEHIIDPHARLQFNGKIDRAIPATVRQTRRQQRRIETGKSLSASTAVIAYSRPLSWSDYRSHCWCKARCDDFFSISQHIKQQIRTTHCCFGKLGCNDLQQVGRCDIAIIPF